MADVTLAECDGQIWLVGGDEHLHALLLNELPPGVEVVLLPCATRAELDGHWRRLTPEAPEGAQPWILNPAISKRILGRMGLDSGRIGFQPWSAMLDAAAEDAVAAAAAWIAAHPDGGLLLRQFAADGAVPGHADLQRLRGQLVAAALQRAGVPEGRIRGETVPAAAPADAERLEIVTEGAPPA